jgi:hypothetical protein
MAVRVRFGSGRVRDFPEANFAVMRGPVLLVKNGPTETLRFDGGQVIEAYVTSADGQSVVVRGLAEQQRD